MKHNLFAFATSELSQDAFFCWALDCLNRDEDSPLYGLGRSFWALLSGRKNDALPKIKGVVIRRQFKHVDVLALVVYSDGTIDALVIEDKVNTSEHDDQIQTYLTELDNVLGSPSKEDGRNKDIEEDLKKIVRNEYTLKACQFNWFVAYVKTGFFSDADWDTVKRERKLREKAIPALAVSAEDLVKVVDTYVHDSEIVSMYSTYLHEEFLDKANLYERALTDGADLKTLLKTTEVVPYYFLCILFDGETALGISRRMWESRTRGDGSRVINSGHNIGGRRWSHIKFWRRPLERGDETHPYLFWRIDTDGNGMYLALRYYDKSGRDNGLNREETFLRLQEIIRETYDVLKKDIEGLEVPFKDKEALPLVSESNGRRSKGKRKENTLIHIHIESVIENWGRTSVSDEFIKALRKADCKLYSAIAKAFAVSDK
ncbi:MAG: hypothetical protein KH107_01470 [Megasphaera micronuciformis]|nr:hypothetical protein [Megasphaera micronuciformis]